MLLNYIRENKGKSLLIAGIVLMWVLLLVLFKYYGYADTWKLWGVNSREPIFFDFRLIPGSAESFRNGFEPTLENPYDPGHRIFNYPAFWRLFFYTNITQNHTVWIVSLILILFFVCVVLFPQNLSVFGALLMLLIVFSPASMLLYERGNVDLLVFILCVLAVLAVGYSAYWAVAIILFGAVVKMFPLFGLTVFWRESRRKFIAVLFISILFMVIYIFITVSSQSAAWSSTLRSGDRSYGTFVFVTRFASYLQILFPNLFSFDQWRILFEGIAVIMILFFVFLSSQDSQPLPVSSERNLNAFRMGASIYVGTFLLGNNWDYRLTFLVLTVPQLVQWLGVKIRRHRVIAIGVIVCVVLSCWYLLLKIDIPIIPLKDPLNRSFVFDEVINWMLVAGFTYLLIASSPKWLTQDLRRVFYFYKRETA